MERYDNANGVPLIVMRGDDGFRVYSPANPANSYIVLGDAEHPACSCTQYSPDSTGEYCVHISAVLNSFGRHNGTPPEDNYAWEERLAIQNEGRSAPDRVRQSGPAGMLLKRSVSPDGRIDSLSVEFTSEVDGASALEVSTRAAGLLALQSAIVKGFLNDAENGNGTQSKSEAQNESTGAALAELVSIGGMDSKWGKAALLSPSKRTAATSGSSEIRASLPKPSEPPGSPIWQEGVALRVPCRVITKPSPDGKYTNVERVLPVQMPQNNGGGWR